MAKPKTNPVYGVRPTTKRAGLAVSRPIHHFQSQLVAILAGQSVSVF